MEESHDNSSKNQQFRTGNFSKTRKNRAFCKQSILKKSFLFSSLCFLVLSSCNSAENKDLGTYEDPKIALIETQKVFFILSDNLNKGYKSVDYINEYEITRNKIFNLD